LAKDHVVMAKPTPPLPPEAWARAARAAAALDILAQCDSDDLDQLLADFVRRCWPTFSSLGQ
jgi:hypothetical protein